MFKLIFPMFFCVHAMTYASNSNGQFIEVDENVEKLVNADWLSKKKRSTQNRFVLKKVEKQQDGANVCLFGRWSVEPLTHELSVPAEAAVPSYDPIAAAIFEITYCDGYPQQDKEIFIYCSDISSPYISFQAYRGMFEEVGIIKKVSLIGSKSKSSEEVRLVFKNMFYGCENLTEVDFYKWNVNWENVYLAFLFYKCSNLKKVVLVFNSSESVYIDSILFGDNKLLGEFWTNVLGPDSSCDDKRCDFKKKGVDVDKLKTLYFLVPKDQKKPKFYDLKCKDMIMNDPFYGVSWWKYEKSFLNICPC